MVLRSSFLLDLHNYISKYFSNRCNRNVSQILQLALQLWAK